MKKLREVLEAKVYAPACVGIDLSPNGTGMAVSIGGNIIAMHGWTTVKSRQKKHAAHLSYFDAKDKQDWGHRIHRLAVSTDWIMDIISALAEDRDVVRDIKARAVASRRALPHLSPCDYQVCMDRKW
jgi:hypothetical protein